MAVSETVEAGIAGDDEGADEEEDKYDGGQGGDASCALVG